jgi:hypothetical protein
MPWPTPMHMVQSARLPPVASSWLRAVIISRPPEAPSAMAPPLGFTFSASSASEELAHAAVARLHGKPGFLDYPERWRVDDYCLDEDLWTRGFATVYR